MQKVCKLKCEMSTARATAHTATRMKTVGDSLTIGAENKKESLFYIENNGILSHIDGEIKSRSHSRAVKDWVYCPELGASPWPAAAGWHPVLGSKPSPLLHGRDFLF